MRLTEAQAVAWGRRAGEGARPPLFVGLSGPVGAGKSVLARAIAAGAGVGGFVPSPTFNLVFRYPLPGRPAGAVVHADLYRLRSQEELAGIGWEDLLAERAVLLVEWPERAGDALPADRWDVSLRVLPGEPHLRGAEVRRVGNPGPLPRLGVVRE